MKRRQRKKNFKKILKESRICEHSSPFIKLQGPFQVEVRKYRGGLVINSGCSSGDIKLKEG